MFQSKSKEIEKLLNFQADAVMEVFGCYDRSIVYIINGCEKEKIALFMQEIREAEKKADDIRHQILRQLIEGGLLPDSRKLFAHIIERVDDIANICEDIIEEIYLQDLHLEKSLLSPIVSINGITRVQFGILQKALGAIVSNYKTKDLYAMIQEIEKKEAEVDTIEHDAIRYLFEQDMELAKKLQYKAIIRLVGHVADVIEDISDQIEIIMMTRNV